MKYTGLKVFLLIFTCNSTSDSKISTVLTIFQTAFDIFKTGSQIVDLIRKQNAATVEDLSVQIKAIRNDMEKMIQASTTRIIEEITLQTKLDKN